MKGFAFGVRKCGARDPEIDVARVVQAVERTVHRRIR